MESEYEYDSATGQYRQLTGPAPRTSLEHLLKEITRMATDLSKLETVAADIAVDVAAKDQLIKEKDATIAALEAQGSEDIQPKVDAITQSLTTSDEQLKAAV